MSIITKAIDAIKILTPRMIWKSLIHPRRAARRIVRSTQPDLRGRDFRRAVRQQLAKPFSPPQPPLSAFSCLGDMTHVTANDHDATLIAEGGTVRLLPLAGNLVEIRIRPDGEFPEPFSYGVARPPADWPPVEITTADSADRIELRTADLKIVVQKSPCRLSVYDSEGALLLRETGGLGRAADSGWMNWRAAIRDGEAFYGLGEKTGQINHAGGRFELWNTDPSMYDRGDDPIYMSIPFFIGLADGRAVGLFFDNSYRSWVDFGATEPGALEYRAVDGEFRLYLMTGTPRDILARYTDLTGRMSLPPLWALGFHQCRWSYYPQARVLEVAGEFRRRRLPCDSIHLDIHYLDDYRVFTWDRRRFPDPDGMIATLHEQGFKVVSMIDPGVKVDPKYPVCKAGLERDVFVRYPDGERFVGPVWPGDCYFPDFSDPEVRRWWGDLYKPLLNNGLDAFWNDMNEVALITSNLGTTIPDIVLHDYEGQGADQARIHNVYGLLMARASVEGLQRLHPGRRALILSRSGWAGLQRYAMHWTADNWSTWDHLLLSVQMVLTLGLSGIALTGPDTGGFSGGPTPELFARWMQVGAFTPFLRVHSRLGSPNQEPWEFGPQVERICRRYLDLRYRLLPYLYTAIWQASQTGLPVARALSLVYPEDAHTYSLDDEYLFGDALLVAPVFEAGGASRPVYLPAGEWVDFWSNRRHEGGQTITVDAPLETLPLFVRAGSIIPLWPEMQYVGEDPVDEMLSLVTYLGEGRSSLYEDDGETLAYRQGQYRLSQFDLQSTESGWRITQTTGGDYRPTYTRYEWQIWGVEQGSIKALADGNEVQAREEHGCYFVTTEPDFKTLEIVAQ